MNKNESHSHVSRMLMTTMGIATAMYEGKLKALKDFFFKDGKSCIRILKIRVVPYFSTIPLRKSGGPEPMSVPYPPILDA